MCGELGGQGGTGARYLRCRRWGPGVAAALGARFVEKVFVEEIDGLLELDLREKKRARSRVEVYLIDDGLLSACVGKCAAQGVHGGQHALRLRRCATLARIPKHL